LIGKNGSGKTNVLESISLFERGRGFRKDKINNLISNSTNNNKFEISSIYINEKNKMNLNVYNDFQEINSKKKLLINNSSSKESIKHFESLFSLIFFLPEMERLFLNSPSQRRNFLDRLIYNKDKNYAKLVNNYKKLLFERYKMLQNVHYDDSWINVLEKRIVENGTEIYKKRKQHTDILNLHLEKLKNFENSKYNLSFFMSDYLIDNVDEYNDQIYDQYLAELSSNREFDRFNGGSKIGPHKSELKGINLQNNMGVNQLSTGQQKTVILLIILAQSIFLINELKIKPIIFFDEVCSHLDAQNRELLLNIIEDLKVQTFLTGTEKNLFSFLSTNVTYCNIIEG